MKSLLYLCHSYHYKTRSNRFLVELLSPHFEITEFGYDPYATDGSFDSLPTGHFDVVLCFQILPPRRDLERRIAFTCGVFFPMFDAGPEPDSPLWREYRDFLIVNFSRTMHSTCRMQGLNSRYVQYFPPVSATDEKGQGRLDSAFFWNRVERIGVDTVATLLEGTGVTRLHLHEAPDPGQNVRGQEGAWTGELVTTHWFSDKAQLRAAILESAFYVAPRPTEGIGMSFLEAMALGRCVIAPDMPTMNEYIRHGENGLLYDVDEPLPLPPMREDEVRAMQEAARRSMAAGRVRWERDRQDICRWIEEKYAAEVGPQPRVSIVTCTRNIIRNGRRHWLEQCLRSVREQDYGGEIEHIVIDGASDDGTQELLRHFSGITVVSEPDSGIYDAMNKGLACASGLYVAFLNSDDHYCSPAAVADSVRAMREQDAEASYADAFLISKDDGEIRASWQGSLDLIPFGQYPCHQTVFVKTERLREMGGFDTSLCCIADNSAVCALFGRGVVFARVHDHIVKFRDGGFSNDSDFRARVQEERRRRGQEEFFRWFGTSFTRHECDLLLDFRYRSKAWGDGGMAALSALGEKLPSAAWRREFWRGLFGRPRRLLTFGVEGGSAMCLCGSLDVVTLSDALRYAGARLGAALGMEEQASRLSEMRERLAGRSLLRLLAGGIRIRRYKLLGRILPGRMRRRYRDKYEKMKARRRRLSLKSMKDGRAGR
jgi:glycosyltransferase involved in cell wall biosynthesis